MQPFGQKVVVLGNTFYVLLHLPSIQGLRSGSAPKSNDFTYYLGDVNDRIELERTYSMKDLGVIIALQVKIPRP